MTSPDATMAKRGLLAPAQALWEELKANRRAGWGVFAIALLAGLYGVLLLGDAADATRASYLEAAVRLHRIEAQSRETYWSARAASSNTLRRALEARLWAADSDGVARANMQDWVTNAGRAAGLERLRLSIELTSPPGLPADLRRVTATIAAVPNEVSLLKFLGLIARDPHLLVVDRLHAQVQPVPMIEMALSTYAELHPGHGQR
jgi:hypothetical protein